MKTYHIRINGQLDEQWSDWFDGVVVVPQENGETLIIFSNTDQAALHGLLKRIYNLGIPLLSLHQMDLDPTQRSVNDEE
jgi:hypothetical protein